MLSGTRRYLVIIVLLGAGLVLVWAQGGMGTGGGPSGPSLTETGDPEAAEEPALEYTYFFDVEGWYRITPYEAAVRSAYDLTGDTTEAMAAGIPATLGGWRRVGADEDISDDPGVVAYLKEPTVALQRTYQDAAGHRLVLAIVGNEGADSFLLFSHTPETCYPGRLWRELDREQQSTLISGLPVHVNYLFMEQMESGERLVVMYWYLWDNAQRDARQGVLSMRLNLFVAPGEGAEAALARGWDFLRLLFPTVVTWERF